MRAFISKAHWLTVLWVAGASAEAFACTVCGQGNAQSQGAYIVMTVIMSALPLSMAGGLVVWAIVRARRQNRELLQHEAARRSTDAEALQLSESSARASP